MGRRPFLGANGREVNSSRASTKCWLPKESQALKRGIPAAAVLYFRAATGSATPASLASFAALSVFSQVKSGSLRPKCP